MVLEYGCALFTDRSVASRWYKSVPSLPMPPVDVTHCMLRNIEGYPLESCPPEPQADLPPAYATHKQEPPPAYNNQA